MTPTNGDYGISGHPRELWRPSNRRASRTSERGGAEERTATPCSSLAIGSFYVGVPVWPLYMLTEAPSRAALLSTLERVVSANPIGPFSVSGAAFAVANREGALTIVCKGEDARSLPVAEDSLFPLASASKLATGLLILRLVDLEVIRLDAGLGEYLPEASSVHVPGVTIRRLLCHTSGLPLEISHDLSSVPGSLRYREGLRWPGEMARACLLSTPVRAPGTTVQYSNVAYGLLGLAAEKVTGIPFARALERFVFDPLRIEAYIDRLPERAPLAVADVPGPFAGTELEPYNSPMWRLLGAPWAGITTNAAGLLALLAAYTSASTILSHEAVQIACADQTGGKSGGFATNEAFMGQSPSRTITWAPCAWGLSVEVQGGKQPHWAPSTLPNSFGQIGSSGCLAWHEPIRGLTWVFLGARTTESGWLLRHGTRIARSALTSASLCEP